MNMENIADAIMGEISILHSRIYRNEPPQLPIYPYVVTVFEEVTPTYPSTDVYLNINVAEDPNKSVVDMEALADKIQNALDDKIINNENVNIHINLEQRQYISNRDLVALQMVNLRFVCRIYFK